MLENLMADLRRVYCLYRVSTLGHKNYKTIPSCRYGLDKEAVFPKSVPTPAQLSAAF